MYLFEEVELLGSRWGFDCESEIVFSEWVYNALLVHGVYVGIDSFGEVYGRVGIDLFINGFV